MILSHIEQTELALRARDDRQALADLALDVSDATWMLIHQKMRGIPGEQKEDVYQEIMLNLCHSIGKFTAQSSFFSWFRRLQLNKIADYYRRAQSNRVFYMADPVSHEQIEAEWYSIHDDLSLVCAGKDVDIVYNIAVKGYTYSELADKDGQEYEKVRSDYRRAKVRVRTQIEKQWQ